MRLPLATARPSIRSAAAALCAAGIACSSSTSPKQGPCTPDPAAFDVPGNGIDDDCNGLVDDGGPCDSGLASDSADPLDLARALDLCRTASLAGAEWGVLAATVVQADGSPGVPAAQHAIRTRFGGTDPVLGSGMVVLSTGHAAATGDTSPAFAAFDPGQDMGTSSGFPAAWYAAHGGTLPNAPGCPAPAGATANDSAMLELRIRTPVNARAFSLNVNFFSAEFPEWVCSPYDDVLVVLLDSGWAGTPANPSDGNLAFFAPPGGGAAYPVGVNLASGNTGLFTQCLDGATGCASGAVAGTISTCTSTAGLAGTGFDGPTSGSACEPGQLVGGATGWLTVSGNVNGGEVITLRVAVWDTSDHLLDSVVLVDGFRWLAAPVTPGTTL